MNGELEQLKTPDNVVGYQRLTDDQELVVFVNLGEETETINYTGNYELVLTNSREFISMKPEQLELRPYEAVVLFNQGK